MSKKKQYSQEFKEEAVRLAEESGNKSQVACDLGIHLSVLAHGGGNYRQKERMRFKAMVSPETRKWHN